MAEQPLCKTRHQEQFFGLSLAPGRRTILFVDEIHRWSKAQQDALLLDCEKGTITLIGATTENPSRINLGRQPAVVQVI